MIVGQSQPTCCYLLHQLSGVVQIRLPPNVAIGAGIGAAENRHLLAAHGAGHQKVDAGIFCGAQLQPVRFGALALGRKGFDHQRYLVRHGVAIHLAPAAGRQRGQKFLVELSY